MKWLLKGKPYQVQEEGCRLALNSDKGFGLFMEQGLGKTATNYNIFLNLLMDNRVDVQVCVCPPSLRGNWKQEAEDWGVADHMLVHVWPKVPDPAQLKPPCVVIINYEAFANGGARGVDWLAECHTRWRTRVSLDESIQIKNPQATRTKNLIAVTKNDVLPSALSGLPFTQGVHDLWAQGRFARATQDKYFPWRNHFCQMGGYMGKKVVGLRPDRASEFEEWLRSWTFRAYKADWADLPPKIQMPPREIPLSPDQLRHYREMELDFITFLKTKTGEFTEVEAKMTITKLNKLQQISSGFLIDENGSAHRLCTRIPKLEETKQIIDDTGSKVLVVAFFRESLDILTEGLAEFNPVVLRGGMSDDEVQREKARFNNDSACRVGVLQSSSHKYGHTLLGQRGHDRCHTTIFYENSYNLDDRCQMEDRNHRFGQDADCVSYNDFCCSPVEREAVLALQRKLSVVDAVFKYARK